MRIFLFEQLLFNKVDFTVYDFEAALQLQIEVRASTKGRKRSEFGSEGRKRSIFIRVHFVLRPVRSYILAIFWYFLGPIPMFGGYTLKL